jgi:hypothetical protein
LLSFRNCFVILHQTHVLKAYKVTLWSVFLPEIFENCIFSQPKLWFKANITV